MSWPSLLVWIASPLWVPLLLWLGVGLARICGDGLLFLLEAWSGRLWEPRGLVRWSVNVVAILAFPVAVAVETAGSFLLALGGLALRPFLPGGGRRSARILVGVPVFLTLPAWAPIVVVAWMARRLLWDLVVRPTIAGFRGEAGPRSPGRFESFVALRYLRGRKAQAGVSVVTGLTIGGVALGVWALVVVLSVMAGFEIDLKDKILGTNAHVVVLSYTDRIDDWPGILGQVQEVEGVTAVTPFVYAELVLRSKHTQIGAIFKGIDPQTVGLVTDLVKNVAVGPMGRIRDPAIAQQLINQLDELPPPGPAGLEPEDRSTPPLPGLLVGQEMASTLRVTVGDTVLALSPAMDPGPLGAMSARMMQFQVAGIFHSGMYEYDTKFAYSTIDTASRLLRMPGAATGLEVAVDDLDEAPWIAGLIGAKLPYPYWTRDWQRMNEPLFAALELEKVVMGVILTFIVAVAALNIISTLIMLVIEKGREIAILKAMGATRLQLLRLFVIDGLVVGFIGTVIGITGGLITCAALARWQFIKLESDVYYLDTLPVQVSGVLVLAVAVIAVSIAFLATLYPAWQASSLDPVEGLRDG